MPRRRTARFPKYRKQGLLWGAGALVLSLLWAEHSDLWRALSGLIDWWPMTLENCTVLSVHDGDTMRVQCGNQKVKVRLHCIDAPELA